MATHSSVLAWRIPGMAEPGGLPSMGSHRVGHDWSDLAAAAAAVYSNSLPFYLKPFFLSQDPTQDTTLYYLQVSLRSPRSWQFLRLSLFLMTDSGSFEECTQAFCRLPRSGDWCDISLMSSWGLWVWGRETTQINIFSSHHIF